MKGPTVFFMSSTREVQEKYRAQNYVHDKFLDLNS